MKNIILSAAFLLTYSFIMANDGCTCNFSNSDVKQELESTDVVFFGKVVEIERFDYFYIDEFYDDTIQDVKFKYTFEVEKVYKGQQETTTIEVLTGEGRGCGYMFLLGEKYVVYSHTMNGLDINQQSMEYQFTNICNRTTYEYEKEIKAIEALPETFRRNLIRD